MSKRTEYIPYPIFLQRITAVFRDETRLALPYDGTLPGDLPVEEDPRDWNQKLDKTNLNKPLTEIYE